jgi:hypothetical protein
MKSADWPGCAPVLLRNKLPPPYFAPAIRPTELHPLALPDSAFAHNPVTDGNTAISLVYFSNTIF